MNLCTASLLLIGKKGLIVGLNNEHSIVCLHENEGARYLMPVGICPCQT